MTITMATLRKVADATHKVIVTGLFAFTGFTLYQISGQVMEARGQGAILVQEHPQAGFIEMLRKKAEEEYSKRFDISHRGNFLLSIVC